MEGTDKKLETKTLAFWRWANELPDSIQMEISVEDLEIVWEHIWDLQSRLTNLRAYLQGELSMGGGFLERIEEGTR